MLKSLLLPVALCLLQLIQAQDVKFEVDAMIYPSFAHYSVRKATIRGQKCTVSNTVIDTNEWRGCWINGELYTYSLGKRQLMYRNTPYKFKFEQTYFDGDPKTGIFWADEIYTVDRL